METAAAAGMWSDVAVELELAVDVAACFFALVALVFRCGFAFEGVAAELNCICAAAVAITTAF